MLVNKGENDDVFVGIYNLNLVILVKIIIWLEEFVVNKIIKFVCDV